MALVFPRDMISDYCWHMPRLYLQYTQEIARDRAGRPQGRDLAPPIWRAEFRTTPLTLEQADAMMADFETLRGPVNPFYLYDPTRKRPQSIATDTPLSGASVVVNSIRSDNAALTLSGLPAGFVLTAGDLLSIQTSSEGRDLHRVARGATANGSGVSPEIEVVPHLREQVSTTQAVDLIKPAAEMKLEPGTLDSAYMNQFFRVISFSATQVLR